MSHANKAAAAGAMAAMLRQAAKQGRGGDTMIAHINPQEAQMLKAMGGAGTRNPSTGLLEFRPYGDSGKQQGYSNTKDHAARGGGLGGGGGGGVGQKNNFPDYRGPIGTSNPDTSSAGVARGRRNKTDSSVSTGQTTDYGAPIGVNKYGIKTALPEYATPGLPAQSWGSWKSQMDTYNEAAKKWNQDKVLNTIVNTLAPFGLHNVPPDLNHPNTYTGGDYHTGWNPAEAIGGVVGGLIAPGAGVPLGKIAGLGYDAFGGRPVVLGGPGVPKDWDPRGAQSADTTGGMTGGNPGAQSPGNGGTRGGAGGIIPGPVTAPPPAIFSPPPATTGGNPVPPGIFPPKPPVPTPFQVPGGRPYGFSIFGRAA